MKEAADFDDIWTVFFVCGDRWYGYGFAET